MEKPETIKFILLTPVFIILSHYFAVLPHLYAHIFMAWFLGYKAQILGLYTPSHFFLNKIFLFDTRVHINYHAIYLMGQYYYLDMAIIALAGPIIGNGVLYFVSLLLLKLEFIRKNHYLFYFFLWFSFINLAVLFGYVPIRIFSPDGDMAHIVHGLAVSPWFIYIIFGYVMVFFIWNFFTNTLIQAYIILDLNFVWQKAALMILCTLILFAGYGTIGFFDNGDISHFLSVTSLIIIPGWIMACWPTRNWVKRQMELPRLARHNYS